MGDREEMERRRSKERKRRRKRRKQNGTLMLSTCAANRTIKSTVGKRVDGLFYKS